MPTSMFGVTVTAWVFTFGAIHDLTDRRLVIWMLVQSVVLLVNVGVLVAHRRGALSTSLARARSLHRLGVLLAGAAWGLAGVLWPLEVDLGTGVALLFCYAGMCAGGATTLAGDPTAYGLFATSALFPYLLQSVPDLGWVSALLVAFIAITTTTVVRNERTLRESLALRFENVDLLREAVRERESAIAARADAERVAHAMTRFLAAASHDLRQPVQALSLFVDVLARDPDLPREGRMRAVESLGRTTDALRAMVEGLLDVSRLDAGVIVGQPTRVPLEPLLTEIVAALRDEADAKDVVVHFGGRLCDVHADPVLLSRVLHNLVGNAVRHGARGRVFVAVRRRGADATIQVWDQGGGIDPADQDRIFDEFVQLGNDARDRRKGLGLGLPIVRRICDRNGWRLTLRSTPGRGSVFSVTVPVERSEPKPNRRATPVDLDHPLSVLLVEDDALVADASATFLATIGCTVHAASDGDSALARLAALVEAGTPPDVLVTDHRLPGTIDGTELLRRAAALPFRADIPSILLTGDPLEPERVGGMPADLVVLRKPVSGETLRAVIERIAARGNEQRSHFVERRAE